MHVDEQKRTILIPWVEKFRPKTLSDVVSQESLVSAMNQFLQTQTLPHLLFYGPPGTGKTSLILALAKDFYGPKMFKERVLELNASDERGINTIREKVKRFAQQSIAPPPQNYNYPCPPFKIIVLDEADSLTQDAQSALRRVIEIHTKITRFCLVCNYVSKIIDPIASRCAKFRFTPLPSDVGIERLRLICQNEGVQCGEEELAHIQSISHGDLRKSITLLQSAQRLFHDNITVNAIDDIAGIVPHRIIDSLIAACTSVSYDNLVSTLEIIRREGFSARQIIEQFAEELVISPEFSDIQKAQISYEVAKFEKNLMDGANEELQMKAFFSLVLLSCQTG
ncbi:putative Replication factor C subunit 4 [Blattamonas nauphoetae]|uniref:Replication factor C subunit 4 n=1 Tax=Blattamonas nauphoetae TaxID=2049346 RepID=A0ABQ9XJB7_9EUKA|nr:putative Replication factor C subunit 4 [Blattamonas nauphoetae]